MIFKLKLETKLCTTIKNNKIPFLQIFTDYPIIPLVGLTIVCKNVKSELRLGTITKCRMIFKLDLETKL